MRKASLVNSGLSTSARFDQSGVLSIVSSKECRCGRAYLNICFRSMKTVFSLFAAVKPEREKKP